MLEEKYLLTMPGINPSTVHIHCNQSLLKFVHHTTCTTHMANISTQTCSAHTRLNAKPLTEECLTYPQKIGDLKGMRRTTNYTRGRAGVSACIVGLQIAELQHAVDIVL